MKDRNASDLAVSVRVPTLETAILVSTIDGENLNGETRYRRCQLHSSPTQIARTDTGTSCRLNRLHRLLRRDDRAGAALTDRAFGEASQRVIRCRTRGTLRI